MLAARYAKLLVALAGVATTSVQVYAAHSTWGPIVIGGIAALLVALIPNAPNKPGP